jgi:uncharacterized membrane protein
LHVKEEIPPSCRFRLVGHSTDFVTKSVESDEEAIVMQHPAWVLVIVGVLIAVIGLVWLIAPSIPWLGKLPGDIAIERENFRFYFPLATCILLSLVLTGIMWLVRYFSR